MSEPMPDEAPKIWTAATVRPDMWVDPKDDPRDRDAGDQVTERSNLIEYLRAYRLKLEIKCAGLSLEQMATRSVPPSDMSLLGLIRHLADVERSWFRSVMAGEEAAPLFRTQESREDPWLLALPEEKVVEEAWQAWRAEVANARALTTPTSSSARSWFTCSRNTPATAATQISSESA